MNRIHRGGFGLVVVVGSLMAVPAFGQGTGAVDDGPLALARPR